MPANLTQQYLMAEERFRAATTHEEKVAALEEMIRELPKHKHTEKMYADLKARLARLRKEGESQGGPARRSDALVIRREGAGQVFLIGGPNSGKSSLMAALTNAPVEVTEYPFATRRCVPGMAAFEDVPFQLVDTPSVDPAFLDPALLPLIRQADAAVVVVDPVSPEGLDHPAFLWRTLLEARIDLVAGDVHRVPRTAGRTVLPAFLAATHAGDPDFPTGIELLREVLPAPLPIVPVDSRDPSTLQGFLRACFDLFGVVRAYSKQPGREPDRTAPFLLPRGSTVLDFAGKVHRDLQERFDYARVWGPGKFEGQRVPREYEVQDGDVIEVHGR